MGHHITIVEDDELPEGHDFVFVSLPTGAHIFYRRSTLDVGPLEDSWEAYRALTARKPPSPPVLIDWRAEVYQLMQRTG